MKWFGRRAESQLCFPVERLNRDDNQTEREMNDTLSDRQRYKVSVSRDQKKKKGLLPAMCPCIQFPFICICVCCQRKSFCVCCMSSEGTLWERERRLYLESWISCCVFLWVDGLCFSLLSVHEGVNIMFSFPLCVCVCVQVKRTWEEDALPHTCTLWFITPCPGPQIVCVSVLQNLCTRFFLCEQKQYIQCVLMYWYCMYAHRKQRLVCYKYTY